MKKLFSFLIIIFSLILPCSSQDITTALLVIDVQDFYFPGGDVPLYQPEKAAENTATLIKQFRNNEFHVIYVKHNYEPSGDINKAVAPLDTEKVFLKSEVNCFNGTNLTEHLKSLNIEELFICGMQTHMCVEGAVRAAYDLGYKCTLVEDACTTKDLKFNNITIDAMDVHYSTLATLKSYAEIITTKDFMESLK